MATVFQNSRWRRSPSWIFTNVHFRRHRYVTNWSSNVFTNFGDDRSNTTEMAAVFRNPRWRRPPSWKVHFRLDHHHEKLISSLKFSIKNVTFIGVSRRFLFCKNSAKSRLLRAWRFFGPQTPHSKLEGTKPPKGTCINRNTTFEPLSGQFGPKLWPVGWPRKQKNKKGGRRKSQNRYISPRGGAISQPIFTKFGEFVDLTDVITSAKFGYKIIIRFFRPRGGKSHFPYRKQRAYITVPCATALTCHCSPVLAYKRLILTAANARRRPVYRVASGSPSTRTDQIGDRIDGIRGEVYLSQRRCSEAKFNVESLYSIERCQPVSRHDVEFLINVSHPQRRRIKRYLWPCEPNGLCKIYNFPIFVE